MLTKRGASLICSLFLHYIEDRPALPNGGRFSVMAGQNWHILSSTRKIKRRKSCISWQPRPAMWYTSSWQQLGLVGVLHVSSSSSMPSFAFGDVHVGGNESRSKSLKHRYVYSVLCFFKWNYFILRMSIPN